jgi:hypothetical protein
LQPSCQQEKPDFIGFLAQAMMARGNFCRASRAAPGNLNHSLTTFA